MAKIDDLLAAVTAEDTVVDSVITFLTDLHAQLVEARANANPAMLDQAIASINTQKQKIADAIVANTDAAPTP
jgi:hypothetical protein